MQKSYTKPYGTLKESLRNEKSMVKISTPQNKSGVQVETLDIIRNVKEFILWYRK